MAKPKKRALYVCKRTWTVETPRFPMKCARAREILLASRKNRKGK